MRNFNSISILIFLFFFYFLLITTTKSTDIINTTCKKCSTQSPNLNYKFCSISLHSFPLNQTITDLKQLAIIAMNLTLTNTTDTISAIQKLIDGEDEFDEFGVECLNDCLELYSDAVCTIKDSVEAFVEGKYEDANLMISSVMESSVTCEEGFSEKQGEVKPLTKENYRVYQLSDIALCIINLVSLQFSSSQSS